MNGTQRDRVVSWVLGAIAGISIGISILDVIGILPGWAAKLTPFFVGVLLLYVVLERERVESVKFIVRRLDKGLERINHQLNRLTDRSVANPSLVATTSAYRAIPFKGMIFRSKTEVRIARALEHAKIVYLPPTKARINVNGSRQSREIDFLVFHQGHWGMLEVDGPWHNQSNDQARDQLLSENGLIHIQRFDSNRCYHHPDEVITEFMAKFSSLVTPPDGLTYPQGE